MKYRLIVVAGSLLVHLGIWLVVGAVAPVGSFAAHVACWPTFAILQLVLTRKSRRALCEALEERAKHGRLPAARVVRDR